VIEVALPTTAKASGERRERRMSAEIIAALVCECVCADARRSRAVPGETSVWV